MGCGCDKKNKQTVTAQTPNPNPPTPQSSDNAWWQANPQKPSTVATPMPA